MEPHRQEFATQKIDSFNEFSLSRIVPSSISELKNSNNNFLKRKSVDSDSQTQFESSPITSTVENAHSDTSFVKILTQSQIAANLFSKAAISTLSDDEQTVDDFKNPKSYKSNSAPNRNTRTRVSVTISTSE